MALFVNDASHLREYNTRGGCIKCHSYTSCHWDHDIPTRCQFHNFPSLDGTLDGTSDTALPPGAMSPDINETIYLRYFTQT